VLPFADMSEAGDQDWFAEGIAEELLIALSQVEQLSVMARTSSFAFKDTDKTIAEIADILGVQAVLEGSVRRSGDRVRITAQLVDASNGYNLWSGSYERQLTDIFQLQDELARSIVKTLRVQLGVEHADPLIVAQTENLEAYEWFLRGRALVNWANPDRVFQSVINLERAVELDPNYALAWGYLSFARFTTAIYRLFDEVSPSIVSAYERALLLDPEQSMALSVKAFMTQMSSYNYEDAGRLYQQSIVFRPDALAIAAYSFWYLVAIDQGELAIKLMREAERLDPLHSGLKNNFTMLLRIMGKAEAAVLKAQQVLQVDPRHEIAMINLIGVYAETGRFTEIEQILDNMPPALLDRPRTKLHIGLYHAERGDVQEARDIYRQLLDDPRHYPFPFFARLALKLGEVEQAIDLMEREIEIKAFTLFWIRPLFRNEEALRDHPRYLALLKRIGLDDESVAALHRKMSFD
jgi:TolB-like protein/Tfp pilus assembly protein PilF